MHTANNTTQNGQKNASRRATPSLSIGHNYVSAFTTDKPNPTPCTVIYSLGVVAVIRHAQDIVWQFTVLHVANCHDKILWMMSDYFPVYWFWATVCASTRDNRYNCALPTNKTFVLQQINRRHHRPAPSRLGPSSSMRHIVIATAVITFPCNVATVVTLSLWHNSDYCCHRKSRQFNVKCDVTSSSAYYHYIISTYIQ